MQGLQQPASASDKDLILGMFVVILGVLFFVFGGVGRVAGWIKDRSESVALSAYIGIKILFYLSVIVIGIYCLMRLL
jgi:hypothetical protein